jgi:hypothetical protein
MNEDFNMSMRKFLKQVGVRHKKQLKRHYGTQKTVNMKFRPKLALRLLEWFIK